MDISGTKQDRSTWSSMVWLSYSGVMLRCKLRETTERRSFYFTWLFVGHAYCITGASVVRVKTKVDGGDSSKDK